MIHSDDPMDNPNDDGQEETPEITVDRWHEIHDSGQPHDAMMCPWCGEESEISEAAAAEEKAAGVPMDKWIVYPVMDSVEYMDRPIPIRFSEDGKSVLSTGNKVVGTVAEDGTITWSDEK